MVQQFREHIAGLIEEARRPLFIKQVVWAFVFFWVMAGSVYLNIQSMLAQYPDPPQPPDLILDALPQSDTYIVIGEAMSTLQFLLVFVFMLTSRERFRQLPALASLLILMFIIRGFVITLTPLGQMQPPSENYSPDHWIAQNYYHGMFFSGHTASALIQVMFFHRFKMRGVRLSWVLLPLSALQIFSLLGSHQHYTIDIVGGIFVAYFIVHFDFVNALPKRLREISWLPWNSSEPQSVPVYKNGHGDLPDEHPDQSQQPARQSAEKELEYERPRW